MSSGTANKRASTFRMECAISIAIQASPARIWGLLTNADDFPRWNSTVTSLEGSIERGQKLKLKVPISDRTFTPRVTVFEPEKRMVWSDGAAPMFKGARTFMLTPFGDTTEFSMTETFSGLLLPLIRGSLPDFGPPFEQYASDLKREAETGYPG
jgi:hypothetical protein